MALDACLQALPASPPDWRGRHANLARRIVTYGAVAACRWQSPHTDRCSNPIDAMHMTVRMGMLAR